MKTIYLQCSAMQTSAYTAHALSLCFARNPGTVFVLSCNLEWHDQLRAFCNDERLQFTDEETEAAVDVENLFTLQYMLESSVPAAFYRTFSKVCERADFVNGLQQVSDLLFRLSSRYISTARVLFINDVNPFGFDTRAMDTLIQSIGDRRISIITTNPSKAGHSTWQANRTLSDYAAIASMADYVVGSSGVVMAVTYNTGSFNRCRGWIVLDARARYPFNTRCWTATTWGDAVSRLNQERLV